MHNHSVIAVFASKAEAVKAQEGLVSDGFSEDRIAISVDLTSDGIAAEAPGQAYENQSAEPGLRRLIGISFTSDGDTDTAEARLLADVERGSVVLTVGPLSDYEVKSVTAILKRYRPVAIRKRR
ncbi:MAG: hypothetical protein ACXWCY_07950 [Burkholderiales bacterium]